MDPYLYFGTSPGDVGIPLGSLNTSLDGDLWASTGANAILNQINDSNMNTNTSMNTNMNSNTNAEGFNGSLSNEGFNGSFSGSLGTSLGGSLNAPNSSLSLLSSSSSSSSFSSSPQVLTHLNQHEDENVFDTRVGSIGSNSTIMASASPPPHPSLAHAGMNVPNNPNGNSLHLAHGPPAHLFATPFSPFQHAAFEVEDDLNGVNPSNLFRGTTGESGIYQQQQQQPISAQHTTQLYQPQQQQQQQQQQAQPITIGQMTPQALMNQLSSLMGSSDLANVPSALPLPSLPNNTSPSSHASLTPSSANAVSTPPSVPAPSSRKRARGPSGQPVAQQQHSIDLSEDLEEVRDLNASTFTVYPGSVPTPNTTNTSMMIDPSLDRDEAKKVKHQMTDRQRRAKIKESMDALKALVPLEPNQKADQATIVASSVTLVQNLKDEVAELRKKLQQMELNSAKEAMKLDSKRQAIRSVSGVPHQVPQLSNSPFTSMMASLNGAGVSMWRIGLTGKIIEVNLVFELVSGFSAGEVVGNTPCGPPLFGSLSIMPAAFLKAFSDVAAVPQVNSAGEPLEHTVTLQKIEDQQHQHQQQSQHHISPSSTASTVSPSLEFPISPDNPSPSSFGSTSGTSSCSSTPGTPVIKQESITVNPSSTAQSNQSQASVAPLYANASISNFPVVPQTELQNFFPTCKASSYKCRSLIYSHPHTQTQAGVINPQPHGNFLVNHLAALPYNHVLKLLCRHHTLWGEVTTQIATTTYWYSFTHRNVHLLLFTHSTLVSASFSFQILESIVTLCLVRDSNGQPDYIMLLSYVIYTHTRNRSVDW